MKMKKKTFFRFSILKIFWFMSFAVNFLKSLGRNSKKKFTRAQMRSKLKLSRSLEFISAFFKEQQVINTRGGLIQPPPGSDRVKGRSKPRWSRGSVPSSHARGQRFKPRSRQYLFHSTKFVLVWACFNPSGILTQPYPAFLLSASRPFNRWPSVWFGSLSPLTAKWQATSAAEPNLRVTSTQLG